ncbi:MAG TPA: hypothetical protein VFR42_03885, partial [Candidatus Acidoferrum sp.]|nr:hypothetical protein [Candidatus Acidoferrum sp.]
GSRQIARSLSRRFAKVLEFPVTEPSNLLGDFRPVAPLKTLDQLGDQRSDLGSVERIRDEIVPADDETTLFAFLFEPFRRAYIEIERLGGFATPRTNIRAN